ncbi:MAG: zinc-binding dehydrogenase [Caldithrix sp.]|nr:zinc-binding dehydrogenase [Caldithrix sp.]
MKAIVHHEYGPPEVLSIEEVHKPELRENDIQVRVRATSVNYGDLVGRNFGNLSAAEFNMPAFMWLPARLLFGFNKPRKGILGSEFAGDVEATGNKVTQFKKGDAVFGYLGQKMGAYAEYIRMEATGVVTLKPHTMNYAEATSVPYGAIMALSILKKVRMKSGQKILINGASGSIGSFAVQIAKLYGAEVTGVCGTPRLEFVKKLGADRVIDYTREDFTQDRQTYDLIFDILGKSSFSRCKNVLKPNGIYLLASFKTKQIFQMVTTSFKGNQKVICAIGSEKVEDLRTITKWIETGKMKSIVDKVFVMDQAVEAHHYVESRHKTGHVVIDMDNQPGI